MSLSQPWHRRWLIFTAEDLDIERRQCQEEGKVIADLLPEFDRLAALDLDEPTPQVEVQRLLDQTAARPVREDFAYVEPSDLNSIRSERPAGHDAPLPPPDPKRLPDQLLAAWLCRCAGCLLGKPVEGWRRPRLWGFLKETGNWPLRLFLRGDVSASTRAAYDVPHDVGFIDTVSGMPEDDDLNYTVTALSLMKQHGFDFTSRDVATFWLTHLPILHTCTAERVAYRNLSLTIEPPESARVRNPYREWIGAQIRGDFFGYVCPGRPELAAELAYRDARISHVKNGIYGEMWVAAMIASAFVLDNPTQIVRAGLAQIPMRSRLAAAIREMLHWHDEQGISYDEAVTRLHNQYDDHNPHDWCHTIPNARIVTLGLLWGDRDLSQTLGGSVQPGFDTDCNGATVGSLIGLTHRHDTLPAQWIEPLNDTLHTGVAGYEVVRISKLAEETLEVLKGGP